MKKFIWKKWMAFVIVIVLIASSLCGCSSDKSEIESLMTEFEHSCNELNIDSMLECLDPAISDKIKLATGIASMFTDKNYDEFTEELVSMLTDEDSLNANEFFSSIKITTEKIKTDKESGIGEAIVEYNIAGEDFKKEATFEYVYTMDKWYISSFNLK